MTNPESNSGIDSRYGQYITFFTNTLYVFVFNILGTLYNVMKVKALLISRFLVKLPKLLGFSWDFQENSIE